MSLIKFLRLQGDDMSAPYDKKILFILHWALLALRQCINQQTKFEVPSFTIFKDVIGTKFKKRVTWPRPRFF